MLSKCAAGRDRDWEFAEQAIRHEIVDPQELLRRAADMPLSGADREHLETVLRGVVARSKTPLTVTPSLRDEYVAVATPTMRRLCNAVVGSIRHTEDIIPQRSDCGYEDERGAAGGGGTTGFPVEGSIAGLVIAVATGGGPTGSRSGVNAPSLTPRIRNFCRAPRLTMIS